MTAPNMKKSGAAWPRFLMPVAGLEPARGYPQQILSLHRLPFRHTGKIDESIPENNACFKGKKLRDETPETELPDCGNAVSAVY